MLSATSPALATRPNLSLTLHDGRLVAFSRGSHTILRYFPRHGLEQHIEVSRQHDVPIGRLASLQLLGETGDRIVILSASYASREGFPQMQCGAGSETIVRVLSRRLRLHQTFSELVDSCWGTIEAGDQRWQKDDRTLHLETTRYIAGETLHREAIYSVATDGTVTLVTTRRLD